MAKKQLLGAVAQDIKKHYVADVLVSPQRAIKTLVVGAGGTGSRCLSWLAQMDSCLRQLGHGGFDVLVADGDAVSEANVGRQLFAPSDVGLNKAVVKVTRVNNFLGLRWKALPTMLTPHVLQREGLWDLDLIITAVDKVPIRKLVYETFYQKNSDYTPYGPAYMLDTGNGKSTGQVVLGTLKSVHQPKGSDGVNRLPTVLDLYPNLSEMEEADDGPSCSVREALAKQSLFVNAMVADAAMSLLMDMITKGVIDYQGSYINLHPTEISPIMIDLNMWARMGFNPKTRVKKAA
jgi:PRTRC genetic system ThiF family protein